MDHQLWKVLYIIRMPWQFFWTKHWPVRHYWYLITTNVHWSPSSAFFRKENVTSELRVTVKWTELKKENLSRINEDPCIFGRRSHRMIPSQNDATAASQRSAEIAPVIPTHLFPTVTCCLAGTAQISPSNLLLNIIKYSVQSSCAG